ncbi:hypothetical protein [Brevibacterium gallinarum]|uniref:DNA polymerase III subunit beta n=1 Tax=Brevibacterium gallinarum TaxID=2762220 RepID=A0ABR8WQK6_9MICO|nr:hypothetical protein [Brevibacterium gallinarum]MBD8019364.1 hypothetical protein [Brevibacterium gallinarum]
MATDELRKALESVIPHVDKAGAVPELAAVRLMFTDCEAVAVATNRYTAALSSASVLDAEWLTGDPREDSITLPLQAVKEVLALFKARKSESAEESDVLRIEVRETAKGNVSMGAEDLNEYRMIAPKEVDEELREPLKAAGVEFTDEHTDKPADVEEPVSPATVAFLDVSGLWTGKRYEVPALPHSKPLGRLPGLFAQALDTKPKVPGRLDMAGHFVGLFSKSAAAHGGRIVLEPTARSNVLLLTCGERFLGLLMPIVIDPDSEQAVELKDVHNRWADSIGLLA